MKKIFIKSILLASIGFAMACNNNDKNADTHNPGRNQYHTLTCKTGKN